LNISFIILPPNKKQGVKFSLPWSTPAYSATTSCSHHDHDHHAKKSCYEIYPTPKAE